MIRGQAAPRPVTDEGRRVSAAVQLAIAEGCAGRWMAFRLSDGGTDGNRYATRVEAIHYQLHESQCAYLRVPYDNCTPEEATSYLGMVRRLYDAGLRLTDPEAQRREPVPVRM